MAKYVTPEVELKILMAKDVITASGSTGGSVVDGEYVPPTDEF